MDPSDQGVGVCVVCTDSYQHSELTEMPCGKHSMEPACIKNTFRHALNNESLYPPTCCGKGGPPIPLKHVEHVLDPIFVKEYIQKEKEYATEWKCRTYCAKSRCSKFIPTNPDDTVAECSACQSRTCIQCKLLLNSDEPHTCAEDQTDALLLQQAKKQGWQRCYSCRAVIELAEACNHISCGLCGANFCYVCGVPWTDSGCPRGCPQHGEPEYDEEGYAANGLHRDTGLSRLGFDAEGYNAAGYDIEGRDREGRDVNGLDFEGNPAPNIPQANESAATLDHPGEETLGDGFADRDAAHGRYNRMINHARNWQRRAGPAALTEDEMNEDLLLRRINDLEVHGIVQNDDFINDYDNNYNNDYFGDENDNDDVDYYNDENDNHDDDYYNDENYNNDDSIDANGNTHDDAAVTSSLQRTDNGDLYNMEGDANPTNDVPGYREQIDDFGHPRYVAPPRDEPPTPSFEQIDCRHTWQYRPHAGRCSVCAWYPHWFVYSCLHCHSQVCRHCSGWYLYQVEQFFPGADVIGLASLSEMLDKGEEEAYVFIDGYCIDVLHEQAEAEYDEANPLEKSFFLEELFNFTVSETELADVAKEENAAEASDVNDDGV